MVASSSPAMAEAVRQFYLQQSGIQLWYARRPLPGAAASPAYDFSEPEPETSIESEEVPPPPASGKAAGRLAALQGMVSGKPEESAASEQPKAEPSKSVARNPVPPAEAPQPAAPAVTAEPETPANDASTAVLDAVKANWGIWVGSGAVLVSELSSEASSQLQEALASNILKALHMSVEDQFRIQWPVFRNPQVPGGDSAGLERVLASQQDRLKGRPVILLGVAGELAESVRQDYVSRVWKSVAVDSEHSLATLATDPNAKRSLWQALKAQVLAS